MRHVWPALERLAGIAPRLAEARFRSVCDLPPSTESREFRDLVAAIATTRPPVVGVDNMVELDMSVGSDLFDHVDWANSADVGRAATAALAQREAPAGFVRHLTPSLLQARQRGIGSLEPATIQLGARLLVPDAARNLAPLPGVIEHADAPGAGGRCLLVRHELNDRRLYTCWWGIDSSLTDGRRVEAGEELGIAGAVDEAGLGSYVQVQVVAPAALVTGPPPRWVRPSEAAAWDHLCPDPSPLLGLIDPGRTTALRGDRVRAVRDRRIARSQRVYFDRPMNLVRGRDVWLYDETVSSTWTR
jgi:hypothetical protein